MNEKTNLLSLFMNLFINAISTSGILFLFNSKREIISQKEISLLWNESSKLLPMIDSFLKENTVTYFDVDNIVVVNWPGSFTGVRSIVLTINSINYITEKSITPISFFDLYKTYPIVKNSSRRDLFVKYEKNATIVIESNDTFLQKLWNRVIYWDWWKNLENNNLLIIWKIDYNTIIKDLILQDKKQIEPLYIKKPNIS